MVLHLRARMPYTRQIAANEGRTGRSLLSNIHTHHDPRSGPVGTRADAPRRRRRWAWGTGVVVLVLLALIGWLPAGWVLALAAPRLQPLALSGVHGTLWSGSAAQLRWAGRPLGRLHWSLSRQALLGRVHGSVALQAAGYAGHLRFRRLGPQHLRLQAVHARATLQALPWRIRGLQPRGRLLMEFSHIELRHGWPVKLAGTVRWQHASLAGAGGTAPLGTLQAQLHERGGAVLQATLADSGRGPLALAGSAEASPLGWHLQATLAPRDGATPSLRALLRRLGPLDRHGRVQLERRGGLFEGVHP